MLYTNGAYESAHKMLIQNAYAQKPHFKDHADIHREAGGHNFGLNLLVFPYFVCATSEGSEHSLLADAISTKVSCAGIIIIKLSNKIYSYEKLVGTRGRVDIPQLKM